MLKIMTGSLLCPAGFAPTAEVTSDTGCEEPLMVPALTTTFCEEAILGCTTSAVAGLPSGLSAVVFAKEEGPPKEEAPAKEGAELCAGFDTVIVGWALVTGWDCGSAAAGCADGKLCAGFAVAIAG